MLLVTIPKKKSYKVETERKVIVKKTIPVTVDSTKTNRKNGYILVNRKTKVVLDENQDTLGVAKEIKYDKDSNIVEFKLVNEYEISND